MKSNLLLLFKSIIFISLFLSISCVSQDSSSSSSSSSGSRDGDVGSAVGSPIIVESFDFSDNKDADVTVQAYEKGLKITVAPLSSKSLCYFSSYVIQGSSQVEFSIADSLEDYEDDASFQFYNGYVESGAFDSCATIFVTTTWVLVADDFEFDPASNYKVVVDDIENTDQDPIEFNITF